MSTQQDLRARAQRALQRIISRPQTGQRHWHADPQSDALPPPSLGSGQAHPDPYQHVQQAISNLEPAFPPGQLVLFRGRQPRWNKKTLFTIYSIYTRDTSTMLKVSWTPQHPFPLVELRQGHDPLVVPFSRIVALPDWLAKARKRKRVFKYRLDSKGARYRRYVESFLAVWAEEDGEVWVMVEWIDGEKREVEKVLARDMRVSQRDRWVEDMKRIDRAEQEGQDPNEGDEEEAASLETEEEYREVLKEFGLE